MNEEEIKRVLMETNAEFKTLGVEHQQLKDQLNELKNKVYLTPEEETEKKRIQKLKLTKKDRMAEIIRDYKATQSMN